MPVDSMNNPDICVQCAARNPTCCRIPPGQDECCFPLGAAERRKLERHLPHAPGPHYAQSDNSRFFLRHLRRLFPREAAALDRLFPADKKHHRLALTADGRCVFLGPAGCVVPTEDRPYYCRIYPFWFVGRKLTGFASPACLALSSARTPEALLPLFAANREALWEIYAQLRLCWGLDNLQSPQGSLRQR